MQCPCLNPYLERISQRRGLRRWLNQALCTRPELPALLTVIVRYLVRREAVHGFKGRVYLSRERLYWALSQAEPEWVLTAPHPLPGLAVARQGADPGARGRIIENRLALDQATALGKAVGLLQEGPRGIWGLSYDLLKQLRRKTAQLPAAGSGACRPSRLDRRCW